MSDTKITLSGSETVTLTGQTIDKLIRAGDGDAALLYLYILKTHGQSTSSEVAKALNKSRGWVASAMAVLSRLGLVNLDDDTKAGTGLDVDAMKSASNASSVDVPGEPRQYTEDEVKNVIKSGSDFSVVVDETQRKLGKILSPDDLLRLFGIYDSLRLPPEVILQLITHCISECRTTGDGRAPSVRYIEKAAYTWEREGVFSLEKAEEYLKALEARKNARGEIKWAMQIKDREFSPTEKRYVDSWITMGFEPDAIAIAYDRTVVNLGKPALAYMDKILQNWHSKGLHTAKLVTEKEGTRRTGDSSPDGKPVDKQHRQKHGVPNREDMERMNEILRKVKEE